MNNSTSPTLIIHTNKSWKKPSLAYLAYVYPSGSRIFPRKSEKIWINENAAYTIDISTRIVFAIIGSKCRMSLLSAEIFSDARKRMPQ